MAKLSKKKTNQMLDALERDDWKPTGSLIGGFVSILFALSVGAQVLDMTTKSLADAELL